MKQPLASVLLTLFLAACGDKAPTVLTERPQPGATFQPTQVRPRVALSAAPGFADQTGGGVFATAAGEAVRLRLDGTLASLESHPGNTVEPGRARAAFRLGPHSALVEADNGLYLEDAGWLIAPPWSGALAPGVVATAQAEDGAVWLAHASGLYRLVGGTLSALKVQGAAVEGITALAAAPAEDTAPGVWFLQGGKLSVAVASTQGPGAYQVRESAPPLEVDEKLLGLAAVGPTQGAAGQLWVLTSKRLLRHRPEGWWRVDFAQTPTQLVGAGRFLWVQAGDALLQFDADSGAWAQASGVDTNGLHLLAADESGCAWVQLGADVVALSRAPVPRVSGLYQGMQVVEDGLVLRAVLPPGVQPVSVAFELNGASVPVQGPLYSMGGEEADGTPKAYSLSWLEPGTHVLGLVARLSDGTQARRDVPFDYEPLSTAVLSWDKDVRPIYEARCAKCHESGPGRALYNYDLWVENAARIAAAVREQRMPADGPLDPQQISLIQRWVASGAKP